jgi:hypothetical protein
LNRQSQQVPKKVYFSVTDRQPHLDFSSRCNRLLSSSSKIGDKEFFKPKLKTLEVALVPDELGLKILNFVLNQEKKICAIASVTLASPDAWKVRTFGQVSVHLTQNVDELALTTFLRLSKTRKSG